MSLGGKEGNESRERVFCKKCCVACCRLVLEHGKPDTRGTNLLWFSIVSLPRESDLFRISCVLRKLRIRGWRF